MTMRRGLASGTAAACLAGLAVGVGSARGQSTGSPVDVTSAPVIGGDALVGSPLSASGGAWRSPNPEPARTDAWWEWWRCPESSPSTRCAFVTRQVPYQLTTADQGFFMFLVRYVKWRDTKNTSRTDDDTFTTRFRISSPTARVASPPPPTPTPVVTPAATPSATPAPVTTPEPTPAPTFDIPVPAATPVPTMGQVLHDSASSLRAMKPFPVVRMRGHLTPAGARVTLLSILAPRKAKIRVRCSGACPRGSWSPAVRKKNLTRARGFERVLRAGTRITVTIPRHGFVGKRTTFVIRRGKAPLRTDVCLNQRGRRTRCPAGA